MGDPIAHSLSPLLHNTAFGLLGLDWVSVGFPVPSGGAPDGARRDGPARDRGPFRDHAPQAGGRRAGRRADPDRPTPAGRQLPGQPGWSARRTNTDGQGFVEALARGADFDPAGKRCVVIGAGGGARAVVLALGEAAASEIVVVARRPEPAVAAAELATQGRVGSARDAPDADLVVNATPLGMVGNESPTDTAIVPGEALGPGQVVVDLVYEPAETAWMAAASRKGAVVLGGLGMLVHQAAAQLQWWTGLAPPVDAMWAAAETARA